MTDEKQRTRMVREIQAEVRSTSRWIGKSTLDARVIKAMADVPRHEFVPPDMIRLAYQNEPLPIGFGQTISQPYIVALMTDLVEPQEDHVVLEVGTGCGYQTAVLSEVVKQVYTIEVVQQLGEQARTRLTRLGYRNIECRIGDGYAGWPKHAPYDSIVVTAAAQAIPEQLVEQLKPGGRMAIPIGRLSSGQTLMRVRKDESGEIHCKDILPVAFVPLTSGYQG
ncbi:MAG: protein-L-isoaspartate(D-aspartate) O-methyltransferase [Acidiferrobacterales bacterium]